MLMVGRATKLRSQLHSNLHTGQSPQKDAAGRGLEQLKKRTQQISKGSRDNPEKKVSNLFNVYAIPAFYCSKNDLFQTVEENRV